MTTLSMFNDTALAAELQSRGWRCVRDDGRGWQTPASYSRKFQFHPNYISRLVNRGTAIPGLELHRANGGRGRLLMVRADAATENWMLSRRRAVPVKTDFFKKVAEHMLK